MLMILVLIFVSCPQQAQALQSQEGDQVTLSCGLTGSYTFPVWLGPPNLIAYTLLDDASGTINPLAPAASRLQYASNNRDLLLSSAFTNDSGVYKCSYTALGENTITLTVSEIGSTTTSPPTNATATATTTPNNPCDRTCIIITVPVVVLVVALSGSVVCFLLRRNVQKKKKSCKVIHSNQSCDNDIVMTSDTRGYEENNKL